MAHKTTIIRAEHSKENPYVLMLREVAQNKDMSYEALGMLVYMLSHSDGFKFNPEDLERKGSAKGRVKRIIKELKDANHLTGNERRKTKEGKFTWTPYICHEIPVTKSPVNETPTPITPKPIDGKSIDGSTIDGKQGDIISNDSIIKSTNVDSETLKTDETNSDQTPSPKSKIIPFKENAPEVDKPEETNTPDSEQTDGAAPPDDPPPKKSKKQRQTDPLVKAYTIKFVETYYGMWGKDGTPARAGEFIRWLRGCTDTLNHHKIGKISEPASEDELNSFINYLKALGDQFKTKDVNKLHEKWLEWRGINRKLMQQFYAQQAQAQESTPEPIPEDQKVTDDDIDDFAKAIGEL